MFLILTKQAQIPTLIVTHPKLLITFGYLLGFTAFLLGLKGVLEKNEGIEIIIFEEGNWEFYEDDET